MTCPRCKSLYRGATSVCAGCAGRPFSATEIADIRAGATDPDEGLGEPATIPLPRLAIRSVPGSTVAAAGASSTEARSDAGNRVAIPVTAATRCYTVVPCGFGPSLGPKVPEQVRLPHGQLAPTWSRVFCDRHPNAGISSTVTGSAVPAPALHSRTPSRSEPVSPHRPPQANGRPRCGRHHCHTPE